MSRSAAEIVREYGPFPDVERVHGVSYDGRYVWFAAGDRMHALDPASGKIVRSIDVAAQAGTAFDGRHLFQLAGGRIQKVDPETGRVVATIEMRPGVAVSGLEANGGDQFFCGGEKSGKVSAVRRPRRGSAAGSGSGIPTGSSAR